MNTYKRIYNLLVEAKKAKKQKTDKAEEGPAMRDVAAFEKGMEGVGPGETTRAKAAIEAGTQARQSPQSPAARRQRGRGKGPRGQGKKK